MAGPRPYRNRRDVRKDPARRPLFKQPVVIGAEFTEYDISAKKLTVTFEAQMVVQPGHPIVVWELVDDGTINIFTGGILSNDGMTATFSLPTAPGGTSYMLMPAQQPSLLSGQNWQQGMAIAFFANIPQVP